MTPDTNSQLVVVGVDGSQCSRVALRFAAREAGLRHARLRIVTAWSVPAWAYAGGYTENIDPGTFEHEALVTATAAADEARAIDAGLDLETSTPRGQATASLLAAAGEADMLVVGSRGHGGFARLLLGSVSEQLAHHSPCPVTIVRGPAGE